VSFFNQALLRFQRFSTEMTDYCEGSCPAL